MNFVIEFFQVFYLVVSAFGLAIGCASIESTLCELTEFIYDKNQDITLFYILAIFFALPVLLSIAIGNIFGKVVMFMSKHFYKIFNNIVIIKRK